MKKYISALFVLLCVCNLTACHKTQEVPNPEANHVRTWEELFISYWQGMNHSYVFWDVDPTDWDKVYEEYLPKFRAIDEDKDDDEEATFAQVADLFTELTSTLIDHHYALIIDDSQGESTIINPGLERVMKRDDYHDQTIIFLGKPITKNIENGRITTDKKTLNTWYFFDENTYVQIFSYKIEGIVYLWFSNFFLGQMLDSAPEDDPARLALEQHLAFIKDPQIKGIIIDLRCNTGGYVNDLNLVVGSMITSPFQFASTRHKNGMGRLDYSPWVPSMVYPMSGSVEVKAPIVVLTDIYSNSMSESVALAIQEMPNGCHIGERTFGANGPLDGNFSSYFSGSFNNYDYSVYTSSHMLRTMSEEVVEGYGVTPQIPINMDIEEILKGNDVQLERAIKYIKEGK